MSTMCYVLWLVMKKTEMALANIARTAKGEVGY